MRNNFGNVIVQLLACLSKRNQRKKQNARNKTDLTEIGFVIPMHVFNFRSFHANRQIGKVVNTMNKLRKSFTNKLSPFLCLLKSGRVSEVYDSWQRFVRQLRLSRNRKFPHSG